MLDSLINGINSIASYLSNLISSVAGIYHDVDLTDLFVSIFPNDIAVVCAAVLSVLIFVAIVSIVKRIILFIGG